MPKRTTILGRINNILFIKLLKDSAALEYIFITGNWPALDVAVCPGGASFTKLFFLHLSETLRLRNYISWMSHNEFTCYLYE